MACPDIDPATQHTGAADHVLHSSPALATSSGTATTKANPRRRDMNVARGLTRRMVDRAFFGIPFAPMSLNLSLDYKDNFARDSVRYDPVVLHDALGFIDTEQHYATKSLRCFRNCDTTSIIKAHLGLSSDIDVPNDSHLCLLPMRPTPQILYGSRFAAFVAHESMI